MCFLSTQVQLIPTQVIDPYMLYLQLVVNIKINKRYFLAKYAPKGSDFSSY